MGATGVSTCANCEVGKYATFAGNPGATSAAACTACATSKTTVAAGSSQEADCLCQSGFTRAPSGDCEPCGAGKYGDPAGSCATCVRGKYSETSGATSDATCVECAVGKYSDVLGATGVGACQDCPAATLSPAGSSSSDACVAGVLVCSVVLLPSLPLTHMYM